MTYIIDYFLPYSSCFPRLSAADRLFLFGVKYHLSYASVCENNNFGKNILHKVVFLIDPQVIVKSDQASS